jgi:hypothetical protein
MFWIIIGIIIAYVAFVSLKEGLVPISMCVIDMLISMSIIDMLIGMSIIAIITVIILSLSMSIIAIITVIILSLKICMNYIKNKEKRWLVFLGIITVSIMIFISALFLKELWIVMSGIAIGTFILSLVCMNYLTNKSKKEQKEISLIRNKIHEIKVKINKLKYESEQDKINNLKNEIEELIAFLRSLSKMVDEDDSLICKEIINKNIIEKLEGLKAKIKDFPSQIKELTSQEFDNKKKKSVEIIDSLRVYIDLISTPEGILLSEIDRNIDDNKKNIEKLEDGEKTEKIIELRDKIIKLRDRKIEILSKEPEGVLDKHEIRRSLTITLTIVYFMLLFFSIFSPVTTTTQFINMTDMIPGNISGDITVGDVSITADKANITLSNTTTHTAPNLQSPFIEVFTYIYLAVIAFYFGSRAIETYTAMKKK